MSAEITSQEDLDDVAFRALLAPLALEVLPVPSPPSAIGTADPDRSAADRTAEAQLPKPAAVLANPVPSVPPILPEGGRRPASLHGDPAAPPIAVIHEHCPSSHSGEPTPPAPSASPPMAAPELPSFGLMPAHKMRSGPETRSDGQSSGPPLTVLLVPGMLAEHGLSPQTIVPPDSATPGTEMLPGDWSLPGELPDLAAPTSGVLPEDWSIPAEFASSLPFDLPPEELEDHPLPPTGHFASLGSGMVPTGRWRFTVAVPGLLRESQAPADSVPAAITASSTRPAAELRPRRLPATTMAPGVARPNMSPRLVARAGAARDAVALPVGQTQLVTRKPLLPPAQVRWSAVLLAGVASAFLVACVSWLFDPPSPAEPAETGVAAPSNAASTPPVVTRSLTMAPTPGQPSVPSLGATSAPDPAPAAPGSLEARPASPTVASQAATQSEPAPAAPSAATTAPKQSATPPQAMIGLLMRRGDAALAVGDIIAARLLYERAAAMGSATAATAAGKTYDLDFLLRADTHGILPDSAAAAAWYRKAAALGDPEARTLLGRFETPARP